MKLSTLNGKLKLLSIGTNSKTSKGDSDIAITAIMYLSPYNSAGYGNVCSKASPGCIESCLYTAGRGSFSNVIKSRERKTALFFEDNKTFKEQLYNDLILFNQYIKQEEIKGFVRLNGTSDIDWSKIKINNLTFFELFSDIIFYDYTKDFKRISNYNNYHITYSKTEETSIEEVKSIINKNNNVAVVFDTVPSEWEGIEVIDGDVNDLRPEDIQGVIVGLKAKGKAKQDDTGFVHRINTLNV